MLQCSITLQRSPSIVQLRHCVSVSNKRCQEKATIDRIIRVDHAGELGADRIYAGQMAVLG